MEKSLWSYILLVYRPFEALFTLLFLGFKGLYANKFVGISG